MVDYTRDTGGFQPLICAFLRQKKSFSFFFLALRAEKARYVCFHIYDYIYIYFYIYIRKTVTILLFVKIFAFVVRNRAIFHPCPPFIKT